MNRGFRGQLDPSSYEIIGSVRYKTATRLPITAGGGGANGPRLRVWKLELQKPAHATELILQGITDRRWPPHIETDDWHPDWNYKVILRPS